jgi:translation initiation factor 6
MLVDHLGILQTNFNGNVSVGIVSLATDSYALIPRNLPKRLVNQLHEVLKAQLVKTTVYQSHLIGILAAGNSNGLLTHFLTTDDEIKYLKKNLEIPVERLKSKLTVGNCILANDKGAIVASEFEKNVIQQIEDVLDVEVVSGQIVNSSLVGAIGTATNEGAMVHPMTTEKELKWISEGLKVQSDIGTVNRGVPYVSTGILINSQGCVTGEETTGPELARISQTFAL